MFLKRIIFSTQPGGRYHIETSPLICGAKKWTGFYMKTATFLVHRVLGTYDSASHRLCVFPNNMPHVSLLLFKSQNQITQQLNH